MKNIYEVIRARKEQLNVLQRELQVLEMAVPLLAEANDKAEQMLVQAAVDKDKAGEPPASLKDVLKRWP